MKEPVSRHRDTDLRGFIATRIRGLFTQPEDLTWANEVQANLFVAMMMFTAAFLVLLCFLSVLTGMFAAYRGILLSILFPLFILMLVPALICYRLRGKRVWLKLFLLGSCILAVSLLEFALTHRVILCFVFPILLSVRYYSGSLTAFTGLITSLALLLSSWISALVRVGLPDMNLVELPAGTVLETDVPAPLRDLVLSQTALDYRGLWRHALLQSYLPMFFLFLLIAFICALIAHRGRAVIVEVEKAERLTTELELAKTIQATMLPHTFPAFPERKEFDIYARTEPAKELGGDFYDFQMIGRNHLALLIADVAGKGIPAAMFMMAAKIVIQNLSKDRSHDPAKILKAVNRQIESNNPAEMFVTIWLGILEISPGQLLAANAGHEYPCVRHSGGDFSLLKDPHGLVLGAMGKTEYRSYEIQLEPGDTVFLYTDGVTEATDEEEELFGTERMLQALNQTPDAAVPRLVDNVRAAIRLFVKDAPQADDITLMALKYFGEAGRQESEESGPDVPQESAAE